MAGASTTPSSTSHRVPRLPRPTPSAPPPPSPPWVILGRVHKGDAVAEGADLLLATAAPPRVTHFSLSSRTCLLHFQATGSPFVLAADDSGRRLLVVTGGGWPRPPGASRLATLQEDMPLAGIKYLVCDVATRAAFWLPMDGVDIANPDNLGIIADPEGDSYVVAELQHIIFPASIRAETGTLLRYWSNTRSWTTTVLRYPQPARQWGSNGVIAHAGKLWWIDLAWGVLTCDPFAQAPVLHYVPLPLGCAVINYEDHLEMSRCIKVSDGKLRYVQMTRARYLAPGGAPTVKTWTLTNPDSREWTSGRDVNFAEVWADESYKATGLPERGPALGLVHPKNPDVVYFFRDKHLFSVDIRAKRVLECEAYDLPMPMFESHDVSSRFVHAWELPPSTSLMLRRGPSVGEPREEIREETEPPPRALSVRVPVRPFPFDTPRSGDSGANGERASGGAAAKAWAGPDFSEPAASATPQLTLVSSS